MTDHRPRCTCNAAVITSRALAGKDIPPCDEHRPAQQDTAAPALNSPALTASICAALGATETTEL